MICNNYMFYNMHKSMCVEYCKSKITYTYALQFALMYSVS
jgi:hypothetical protein